MENTSLTIIYTYFGQKELIPNILREKHPSVRVVIVDDCSPEPLGKLEGIDVYRVEDDIPWNAGGAINLGFQESEGWIVYADIDCLVTRENVEEILNIPVERGTMYPLGRTFERESDELFLIHKDDFEEVGGFDEDFSGNYGYLDILFKIQCEKNLKVVERRDIKTTYFPDSINTTLDRDESFNRALFDCKMAEDKNVGTRIRFKWHKV